MRVDSGRSPLGVILLGMLFEAPMHAYRMQKLIKQRGVDKVVNVRRLASVYQALEQLLRLQGVSTASSPRRFSHHAVRDWISFASCLRVSSLILTGALRFLQIGRKTRKHVMHPFA
jgi:hypothetical protein